MNETLVIQFSIIMGFSGAKNNNRNQVITVTSLKTHDNNNNLFLLSNRQQFR